MTQTGSEHWSSSSDRADTSKFPDFDQSLSTGDPWVTQEEDRDRVASPRPRSKPNGSLYGDRWQHRRDNHIAWDNGHARGPSRHKRQPSLSDAIRTIRTRKGSVSANAHEIAEALKAPVSLKLILLCIIWYMSSALTNTSSKSILNIYPQPITLTLIQFAFVSSWCLFVAYIAYLIPPLRTAMPALRQGIRYPNRDIIATTFPLALFQIGGHILSSEATEKIPVSLVHTIKGLSPLFTVLAYRFLFRIRYGTATYLSLIPLTLGVILACSVEFSGNLLGILYAFGGALIFVTQNIFSKKLFNEAAHAEADGSAAQSQKLDKLNLLCYCSGIAFLLTLPIWIWTDGLPMLLSYLQYSAGSPLASPTVSGPSATVFYLPFEFFFNGVFHFAQNILAFILLSLVSPVTYSVASLIKRVIVIAFSIVWFGSRTTPIQAAGIALTFLGLYLYDRTSNASKADRKAKLAQLELDPLLPISTGPSFMTGSTITETPVNAIHGFNAEGMLSADSKKTDVMGPGRPRDTHPMPSGLKQEDTWTLQERGKESEMHGFHATVGKEHNIIGANPRLLQLRRCGIIVLLDRVVEKGNGGCILSGPKEPVKYMTVEADSILKNCLSISFCLAFVVAMMRRSLLKSAAQTVRQSRRHGIRAFSATPTRPAEVELTIDGKKVSIEAGSALIQACEKAGVTIPRYCYHEKLMIAGNCRMCLVEVERAPKPVASCAWPVQPGMVVKTDSPLAHKAREGVMEFLLANHPLDCPICDQGGECDLQDQSMRYGADRGRFHELSGKRAVEDKNMGPLIKTSMNRCIHCTRCIRFANDVAGAPELGSTGRGNDMQIGTYLETALDSEMSGNVIDLCPVGALTSKPYAFQARPWELQHYESVDVLDGLGSNVRVDARGLQVMRILPRLNDDINEEWINDKSRFACDGLKTQRLTTPLIRRDNQFQPAAWSEALTEIGNAFQRLGPKDNEFKAIAGHLVETETLVAMKDLANKLNSDNLALDQPQGGQPIAHGIDIRSNYAFNSKIFGVEEADAILLVGTNPRHEAAVLNARIRKQWLRSDLEIGLVGTPFDSTFEFQHLGNDAAALKKALTGSFGKLLQNAKRPMIIVGSFAAEHPDSKAIFEAIGSFVDKNPANFLTPDWQGYNVLQRAASRTGAYEVGFTVPSPAVAETVPKIIWLLGADEISASDLPKDAFVIYQGHHGDRGAQLADVVLPGVAYTEKHGTYLNTEGRVQMTRAATGPPGAARDDWKIIRAASEFVGAPLPYEDVEALRDRMEEISPALRRYDIVEGTGMPQLQKVQLVDQNRGSKTSGEPFRLPIEDFYLTDAISRSSPTMARCSAAKKTGNPQTNFMAPGEPDSQVAYGPPQVAYGK